MVAELYETMVERLRHPDKTGVHAGSRGDCADTVRKFNAIATHAPERFRHAWAKMLEAKASRIRAAGRAGDVLAAMVFTKQEEWTLKGLAA